jgi:NADH-quinone oxidoreductase E subunit
MAFKYTDENFQRLNKEIAKYPVKQPAVMAALWIAQEQNGFISNEVIEEVASLLEMHTDEVLGIVTFYTMYQQKPMGKNHIQVCTNVSCMLKGGYEIYNHIKDKLKIENMQVTDDMRFSIEEVECMGSCGTAPMFAINEDFYENLDFSKVDEILDNLRSSK